MIERLIYIFVLGFCSISLNACSTMEGFGKDVQGAGQAIEKKAKENKKSTN